MDGSGAVEWEEFCVLMFKKMRETDPENEVKELFRYGLLTIRLILQGTLCRVFDAEGVGTIGESRLPFKLYLNLTEHVSHIPPPGAFFTPFLTI